MASEPQDVRPKIILVREDCKERNYITKKNRCDTSDHLQLKKYCPRCSKSTSHHETR